MQGKPVFQDFKRPIRKKLQPTGMCYVYPRRNPYGRVVGEYRDSIESSVSSSHNSVLETIHWIRQYKKHGLEKELKSKYQELKIMRTEYKRRLRNYLKAIAKAKGE